MGQAELEQPPEQMRRPLSQEFEEYARRREAFEKADAIASSLKKDYKEQEEKLWRLMEASEVKTISHDRLGRVTRVDKKVATVLDDDVLKAYLDEVGELERYRYERWAQAELNRLVKESLAETGECPPGLDVLLPIQLNWTRPKAPVEAVRIEQED